MSIKSFLGWSGLATPGAGLDMLSNSIRKGMEYDAYGDQTRFKAVALTDAWPLAAAHAAKLVDDPNWDWSAGSAEVASPSFIFKGRIIGENSPHTFLPDPCDPAISSNPQQVMSIIKMHTSFVSSTDVSSYDGGIVKEGDVVWVELRKNVFSYDLQYGTFISKSKQAQTVRGRQDNEAACSSLAAAFNDAAWATGGDLESDPNGLWADHRLQETANWTHPDTLDDVLLNGDISSAVLKKDASSGVSLLFPIYQEWIKLKAAFENKFPEAAPLKASGYRSYDGQVAERMKRHRCSGQYDPKCTYEGTNSEMGHAARPGTSDHGWGAAIDLSGNGSTAVNRANGGVNPFRSVAKGGNAPNNPYFKWINMYSSRFDLVFSVSGEHWHLDWTKLGDHLQGQTTAQTSIWNRASDTDESISFA